MPPIARAAAGTSWSCPNHWATTGGCASTYPSPADKIADARRHILEAHAARLSEETGQEVTVADIEAGRTPRPRVLDMFAGGGAIPLEALRLGCETHALELNPVAHLIGVTIDAKAEDGFDPVWLRNAVLEPLEEADIEVEREK